MSGRVLLVGEQPPSRYSALHAAKRYSFSLAMYPYPARSAGGRMHAFSGLSLGEYIHGLERVNLIPEWTERWDKQRASINARSLITCNRPSTVFTLGVRVAEAFGYSGPIPSERASAVFECTMVYLPHPSGRNPVWREPAIQEFVAAAFDKVRPVIADWQERRTPLITPSAED